MGQEMCDCLDVGSALVPVVIIGVDPPPQYRQCSLDASYS